MMTPGDDDDGDDNDDNDDDDDRCMSDINTRGPIY